MSIRPRPLTSTTTKVSLLSFVRMGLVVTDIALAPVQTRIS
jgi:hypothetical protein